MADQAHRTPPDLASRQLTLTVLAVAGLLAQRLPLPWSLAGLAFLVPAVVLGARLVRDLTRAKAGGLLLASTTFTLVLALIVTVMAAGRVAVYPAASGFEQCMADAITEQAKVSCEQQRVESVTRMFTPATSPPAG